MAQKTIPRRLEVFCSGIFLLDNYRKLKAWGLDGFTTKRLFQQDKGHVSCCKAFLESIRLGLPSPIPHDEIFEVQRSLLSVLDK